MPEAVSDNIVFIGSVQNNKPKWKGTAFFVALETPRSQQTYLVAPKHIVAGLSKDWCVRVNLAGDTSTTVSLSQDSAVWYYHPSDDAADVAVLEWPGVADQQYRFCEESMLLTPEMAAEESVSAGDQLFIVSLFTRAIDKGGGRNEPIVRSGVLSLSRPISLPVPGGVSTELYLAETRSFGGMSGSPVYVAETIQFKDGDYKFDPLGPWYLMGMMRGHWKIPVEQLDEYDFVGSEGVNLGISLVTPAHKILETLRQPDLTKRTAASL
ncbi:MAG: hypothetical protein WA410_08000 [Candidatus Binatus sp.]